MKTCHAFNVYTLDLISLDPETKKSKKVMKQTREQRHHATKVANILSPVGSLSDR